MQKSNEASWRECEFVSPTRAAQILGYSVGTIRNLLFNEGLRAVRLARSGPMFVTVESLVELIDGAEPISKAELGRAARPKYTAPFFVIQGGRK
jgi:hypothetical protein